MPTSLIAPLVTGAASYGASKLFGGGGPKINYSPPSINAGGLSGTGGNITASDQRMGLVNNIAGTYGPQADDLSKLRDQLTPGFGALTNAGVTAIHSARDAAIGNLRENLQRRRVLGSSFGQDAVTRSAAEFGNQEASYRAQSFLSELDANQKLTQQMFDARRGQYQTGLDELNLEANAGTQLASQASAQLGANARLQAQLDAMSQQNAGRFFGQAFQPFGAAVGKAATTAFNNPNPTPQFFGTGGAPY